jgi:hypothetical protein
MNYLRISSEALDLEKGDNKIDTFCEAKYSESSIKAFLPSSEPKSLPQKENINISNLALQKEKRQKKKGKNSQNIKTREKQPNRKGAHSEIRLSENAESVLETIPTEDSSTRGFFTETGRESTSHKEVSGFSPELYPLKDGTDQSAYENSPSNIGHSLSSFPSNIKSHESNAIQGSHPSTSQIQFNTFNNNKNAQLTLDLNCHVPEVVDSDVENFKSNMESLIVSFRNKSLQEFIQIKREMLLHQSSVIEGERNKCNSLLQNKQNQIQILKQELQSLGEKLHNREAQMQGMGNNLCNYRLLLLAQIKMYKTFHAWKQYKNTKRYHQIVILHYFSFWVYSSLDSQKERKRKKTGSSQKITCFMEEF